MIGPDGPSAFRDVFQRERLPFRGVPDPGGALLGRLGQESRWLALGRLPALLGVDAEGVVRVRQMGRSMRDLPDLDHAMTVLRQPSAASDPTARAGSSSPDEG